MKKEWLVKTLALGIVVLFVILTISSSISIYVVAASNDNDFVEVTTQAFGFDECGNTTVNLTREQYQYLKLYLADSKERLNLTSTREEAVSIFKEVVVELNKYKLLPKGMSVEQAQKFVTDIYQGNKDFEKIYDPPKLSQNEIVFSNVFCLLFLHCNPGDFSNTELGLLALPFAFFFPKFFWNMWHLYNVPLALLYLIPTILSAIIGIPSLIYNLISPLKFWVVIITISSNQAWSLGLMGFQQIINSNMVIGFKGLSIRLLFNEYYYIGHALAIQSSTDK